MTILSMKDHLRKRRVFTHDEVFDEEPESRLATQAVACAQEPTTLRLEALAQNASTRYLHNATDATVWFAFAVVHLKEGNPEVYKDVRRMVWCRKDDQSYLTLALSILAQDERRSEAARSCAQRVIETTLRHIPYDDEAVGYARTVNEYHLGWNEEEFNTRLAVEKERSRFTR